MTTGETLQEARELAGLTQEQLAEALRVHRTTVVTWEGKAVVKSSKAKRYLDAISRLQEGKAA